jgi:hypothetical protein
MKKIFIFTATLFILLAQAATPGQKEWGQIVRHQIVVDSKYLDLQKELALQEIQAALSDLRGSNPQLVFELDRLVKADRELRTAIYVRMRNSASELRNQGREIMVNEPLPYEQGFVLGDGGTLDQYHSAMKKRIALINRDELEQLAILRSRLRLLPVPRKIAITFLLSEIPYIVQTPPEPTATWIALYSKLQLSLVVAGASSNLRALCASGLVANYSYNNSESIRLLTTAAGGAYVPVALTADGGWSGCEVASSSSNGYGYVSRVTSTQALLESIDFFMGVPALTPAQ